MRKEKIRVLLIEPACHPKPYYLEPSIKAFRKAVRADRIKHGGLEAKKLDKNIYAIFNKDRFLANLEANRCIDGDIIAGNIYIVATDDKRFPISLTDKQISRYALLFWDAEYFDEMEVAETNLNTMFSKILKDEDF